MIWIGLTGTIGSGKSSVADLLRKHGFPVLDADQFARQALSPGTPVEAKVLAEFGATVRDAGGRLDRKKLAAEVFQSEEKLRRLEAIVHPAVQSQTQFKRQELDANGYYLAFYDVPLLFEKKLQSQFDAIVVVFADLETCVRRTIARSGLRREEVEARIRAQLTIEEKIKKAHWVVRNDRGLPELEVEVAKLIQDIGRRFPKSG